MSVLEIKVGLAREALTKSDQRAVEATLSSGKLICTPSNAGAGLDGRLKLSHMLAVESLDVVHGALTFATAR